MEFHIPKETALRLAEQGVFFVNNMTHEEMGSLCSNITRHILDPERKEVTVLIDSQGGSATSALCFADFARTLRADIQIIGVAFAECGSAALALLQCCHRRKALKGCGFFIHHLNHRIRLVIDGTEEEQARHQIELGRKIEQMLVQLQCGRAGISADEWNVFARKGEHHGAVLTAKDALQHHLLDEIIDNFPIF